MKVLIVHNEIDHYAGAERMLEYFVESARESDDVTIEVACGPNSKLLSNLDGLVPVHRLPPNQPGTLRGSIAQIRALRRTCAATQPDIVHAWHARAWEPATIAGWFARLPVTAVLHDHPEASFISPKRRFLMRSTANSGIARLICVSEAVRSACVESGYRERRVVTVHNGLPGSEVAKTTKREEFAPELRIGFLGAFSSRKGLDLFFSIIDSVAGSLPDVRVLVGGGASSGETGSLVETLGTRYGNRDWWENVEWLGWVSDISEFFESIDLLLFTSKEFDPLPTVIIEAGMAGVPVIASRVGGVEEIIQDGETGFLFDPTDPETAAGAIRRLANNPRERIGLGARHRDRISTRFTCRRMLDAYLEIWNDLLKQIHR